MKILRIIPVLGLAALLAVGCAQPVSASSDSSTDLAAEASECPEGKSCCAEGSTECTPEEKAACEAECPAEADTKN